MDPLSHAVVGSTAAVLSAKNKQYIKIAAFCGIAAGMFPDIDVVIKSYDNPMFGVKYHRHFTHSLVFIPIGALIVSFLISAVLRLQKSRLSYSMIYLFCLAGISTHGLLDSLTNYGTHLFWPFTERRESWSIISIVDPIFTFTILFLLIASVRFKTKKYVLIASIFAVSYWLFGLYQREKATDIMQEIATSRGHIIERYEVKPSIANIFVWRVQYEFQNTFYIDAIHMSPWAGNVVYEGGNLPEYQKPESLELSYKKQKDLEYFTFFSDGWIARSPNNQDLIGDVRFSMLPNQIEPIWGIYLKNPEEDKHVKFENVRTRKEGDFTRLWQMIKGEPL